MAESGADPEIDLPRPALLQRTPLLAVSSLGLPLVLAATCQFIFNLTEVWVFGQLGDRGASLAGAAASDVVTGIFAVLAHGLGNAAVAHISFCKGARDELGVRRHARQALALGAVLSIACAVVGLLASVVGGAIIPEGPARTAGVAFLRVMALGGFGTIYVAFSVSILRALGDSMRPLMVVAAMSIGTLVLEMVFLLGWFGIEPKGVVAAAWITVLMRGLAAAGGIYVIHRHISLRTPRGERFIDWSTLRVQLKLGMTGALQQVVRLLGLLILLGVAAVQFGPAEYTAVNIWIKLDLPTLLMSIAWGGAVAPVVGMSLGAKRLAFARKAAWSGVMLGVLSALVTAGIVMNLSDEIVTALVPDVPTAVGFTHNIVVFAAPAYVFLTMGIVISGAYNGAGNMVTPLVWDVMTILVTQSLVAVVLARPTFLGITGIGVAVLISRFLQGAVAAAFLVRARWHRETPRGP